MDDEIGDLAFLPLGGTGEIGMNLNLYRCDGRWLAVDCGIGFGGAAHPEVDVMMADPGFIADRRDRLVGLSMVPVGGPPSAFKSFLEQDQVRWSALIKAADIKVE